MAGESRTGGVAITGASGQVGTLLRRRLVDDANRIVALNRGDDWGASVRSAEVVVHLAGTLQPKGSNTYEAANVETTEAVARAVSGGDVKRIAFLSYVGPTRTPPMHTCAQRAGPRRFWRQPGFR